MLLKTKPQIDDVWAGLSGALVALPSAIAFGLLVFAGGANGALYGMIGAAALALVAPFFTGANRLVTAPCAPSAAVLSGFVLTLQTQGLSSENIFLLVIITGLFTGLLQLSFGFLKGGTLIKYIPYPVVAGYLSGVGIIIFTSQMGRFLGLSPSVKWYQIFYYVSDFKMVTIFVGSLTVITMLLAPKMIKKVPPAIIAVFVGVASYFIFGQFFDSKLLALENNPFVVGPISAGGTSGFSFAHFLELKWNWLWSSFLTAGMLALLLSIDTLKTCLVVDALIQNRHDSNQELKAQGLANLVTSLVGGMPGAGTMGATLVTLTSGAKTNYSGLLVGLFCLVGLLLLQQWISWLPLATLSGVLLVVGIRMIDWGSINLLKSRRTIFDFIVILIVILTAVAVNLIAAAGAGILLSVILFLREQVTNSVVRRKVEGSGISSSRKRSTEELKKLELTKNQMILFELQGSLFFGTTDQLLNIVEPELSKRKYILLDFRRVQSLDYSAANLLKQLSNRAQLRDVVLILSDIPESKQRDLWHYLKDVGLKKETSHLKFFKNIDDSLEFVEDTLLDHQDLDKGSLQSLKQVPLFSNLDSSSIEALEKIVRKLEIKKGEKVFHQGDIGDEIFVVMSGVIRISLKREFQKIHVLASFSTGDFFGDISFLDSGKRTADAIAETDSLVYKISRRDFEMALEKYPEAKAMVFEKLSQLLALRLRQADAEISALTN